jgi:TPP-dependent pyruvate/acetoin dehydrogenase alpha subunit
MIVDGQDTVAVFLAMKDASNMPARKARMMMVECKTYRWYGHSRSDPRVYRTKEEEKMWKDRDPITVLSHKLIDEKLATAEQDLEAIRAHAEKCIEDATQFSMNSPWPDAKDLAKDVYVEETYAADVVAKDKENAPRR